MKGLSTLLFVALAALLILEPTANAVVHRLSPTLTRRPLKPSPAKHAPTKASAKNVMSPLDRLTFHHGLEINMAREQRRLQQQQKTTTDNSCDNGNPTISGGSRVNISVEYGYALVAEMNIGSPAQGPFEMELTFSAQQPYVLKKGAKYSDDGSKVRNVQEFDKKASNTSLQQNDDFTRFDVYLTGSVVSDTLQIGPLSLNQSVQVTKKVDPDFDYYVTDGSLGLGVSDMRDGSSFVEQLASQLDSPVLTLFANQSLSWDDDSQGVLSFGDRVPEICVASSWQKMSSWINKYVSWPAVDIVSATGPADADGCGGQVTANITVGFFHSYMPIYCSVQMQELFVQASGARWDWDSWGGWVVDDASKAVSVKFNTADGQVIEVTPNDYLLEIDGTQLLFTYGAYDQAIYADDDYIVLSQTFLNNHCLSMDMTTGEWSLASVKSPSEADYSGSVGISDPSSSSSSSSSMEADYISRKH